MVHTFNLLLYRELCQQNVCCLQVYACECESGRMHVLTHTDVCDSIYQIRLLNSPHSTPHNSQKCIHFYSYFLWYIKNTQIGTSAVMNSFCSSCIICLEASKSHRQESNNHLAGCFLSSNYQFHLLSPSIFQSVDLKWHYTSPHFLSPSFQSLAFLHICMPFSKPFIFSARTWFVSRLVK